MTFLSWKWLEVAGLEIFEKYKVVILKNKSKLNLDIVNFIELIKQLLNK